MDFETKISLPIRAENDMAFHVRAYQLKNLVASYFGEPMRFTGSNYMISHGKTDEGAYYFTVYFRTRNDAVMFKLSSILD